MVPVAAVPRGIYMIANKSIIEYRFWALLRGENEKFLFQIPFYIFLNRI